jgi:DNA-binding NtrC family response regulator
MHKVRILLAEDMAHERLVIKATLARALPGNVSAEFVEVDHAEAAVDLASRQSFDLVIMDIDFSTAPKSSGMNGLMASRLIKAKKPEIYLVVLSSSEEKETMMSATEEFGVDWYLRRSSVSYDELAWLARQALLSRLHRDGMLVEERNRYQTENSRAKAILRKTDAVLPQQNVLIYGETGTGKELIARRIHANAKAFDPKRPLVILDCSALSPTLFEGEVFGHKKGSYTGAISDRVGALQLANGGDLFLDEIHNIPINLQQKLLRVLNDGVFYPLGSNEEVRSKFRIITATNIPVEEAVKSGKLLPDFIERVRKIKIDLLPLRDRPEDIILLVKAQVASGGLMDKEFSEDALEFLKTLSWPGNARELKSFVDTAISIVKIPIIDRADLERLLVRPHSGPSTSQSLPTDDLIATFAERLLANGIPYAEALSSLEESYLRKSFNRFDSVREIAQRSGLNRKTLSKRLHSLGLKPKD